VTELGRRLGVHKATASRLAATLADHGFVERDPHTDRYRLGFGLIRLAGAAMAGLDLVRTARPVVEELAERTRETVNLGVLSAGDVIYIDQATGARSIVSVSWVGRRTPLHATASGKALLAFAEPDEQARLRTVRSRGYAPTFEELEEGLNSIAAPVRQADRRVVAALSVSGPAFRLRAVDFVRLGRLTLDAATAISRRLGFTGSLVD